MQTLVLLHLTCRCKIFFRPRLSHNDDETFRIKNLYNLESPICARYRMKTGNLLRVVIVVVNAALFIIIYIVFFTYVNLKLNSTPQTQHYDSSFNYFH